MKISGNNFFQKSFKVLCFFVLAAFSTCTNEKKSHKDEGIIEFDCKATDLTHPLSGFAPSAATLKFKGDKFCLEMSVMGMFNIAIIGNNKDKTMVQTVKFLNVKQACVEGQKDLEEDNLTYILKIEETKETKEILGLKSYKLNVTKLDESGEKFEAWYTKKLGVENCNSITSYSSVRGVLLDFRIKKMGLEMHFTAKSYKQAEIPESTFEIPPTMKIVSKKEMQKFFDELQ